MLKCSVVVGKEAHFLEPYSMKLSNTRKLQFKKKFDFVFYKNNKKKKKFNSHKVNICIQLLIL